MKKTFSTRESLMFGWGVVQEQSGLVFKVLLTLLALQAVISLADKGLGDTGLGSLVSMLLLVVSAFLSTGATVITLKLARGEEATYREIWPNTRLAATFFLAGLFVAFVAMTPIIIAALFSFLLLLSTVHFSLHTPPSQLLLHASELHLLAISLCVAIGLVLLAYLAVRLFMVRFLVLDGAGAWESLQVSRAMTQGYTTTLLFFVGALVVLNILGAMALLVGLLVTLPVSYLACARIYDALKNVEIEG